MSEVRRILEGTMQVPISGSLDTPMTSSHASFVSMGHLSGSFYGTSESLWGLSSIPPCCWLKDIIGFELSLWFVIYSHLNQRSCEDLVVINVNKSTTAQHDHIKHRQRKKERCKVRRFYHSIVGRSIEQAVLMVMMSSKALMSPLISCNDLENAFKLQIQSFLVVSLLADVWMNDSPLYKHCILEFWNNYKTHTVPWPKEMWHSWGRMTSVVRIFLYFNLLQEFYNLSSPSGLCVSIHFWMFNIFNSVKSRSKIIVGVFCRPRTTCSLPIQSFHVICQVIQKHFWHYNNLSARNVANCKCLISVCMEFQITESIQY